MHYYAARRRLLACGLLFFASVVSGSADAGELRPVVSTTLEQSADRTVVQWTWSESLDLAKRGLAGRGPERGIAPAYFSLAVPEERAPGVRVLRMATSPLPELSLKQAFPSADSAPVDAIELGSLVRMRGQWIAPVTIQPAVRVGDRLERVQELVIEFTHPARRSISVPATPLETQLESKNDVRDDIFLNPALARTIRIERDNARQGPATVTDVFALSDNWLRMEVTTTGLYRLDYDLLMQVMPGRVDTIRPETFRVFAPGRALQPLLPEDTAGSWNPMYLPAERAIEVQIDATNTGSSFLAAGDALLFFAAGPEDWADLFDPSADAREHFEHEFSDKLVYWLTWEENLDTSQFAGAPLRMAQLDVTPTGATEPSPRGDYRERVNVEENSTMQYGATLDNWLWTLKIDPGSRVVYEFLVDDLAPGAESQTTLYKFGLARDRTPQGSPSTPSVFEELSINGTLAETFEWNVRRQFQYLNAPVELETSGFTLVGGTNSIDLKNGSANHWLVTDFFYVSYRRSLRPRAGVLRWSVYEDEVAAAETRWYGLTNPAMWSAGAISLDITDSRNPVRLVGAARANSDQRLDMDIPFAADARRHFYTVESSALLTPSRISLSRPRRLREEVASGSGYHMVIVHPDEMTGPAEQLMDHRRQNLGGISSPRVTATRLQDIYDQFGHGVKEPAAIRNYLKFLYTVDPSFEFLLLMGDASRDYRNRFERDEAGPEFDRCPTYIQVQYPGDYNTFTYVPYAADDWFVAFDDPRQQISLARFVDLPEAAVGRLPVGNVAEASQMVQRIIDYDRSPAPGPWRNKVLMVADDLIAGQQRGETYHINEAELLAEQLLPPALDVDKLYLTEFDAVPGANAKPSARQAMRERWSAGALVVHYIGHGSPQQMADEAVFRIEDVASLRNGEKRPLFLAFSCDVAIFDDPSSKSMTEQLVLATAGGAVAGIAATQVTFVGPNENLTEAFYPRLYPSTDLDRSVPIGRALYLAKANVIGNTSAFNQHNNQRYHVLGDPAMQLQSPKSSLTLSGDLAQSIQSGRILPLVSAVDEGGGVRTELSGRYYLETRESLRNVQFEYFIDPNPEPGDAPFVLPYRLDGGSFFTGTGTYESGEARAEVLAPAFMRFGTEGRVRVLLESGTEMFVGLVEPIPVERVDITIDDDDGPSIELAFVNNARQVTAGSQLTARIVDPSGVNVLATVPANSIQLEFDDNGFATDVTPLFQLDEGRFDRGEMAYELPVDLSPGPHTIKLSASDMLSNLSSAEISFTVIAAGGIDIAGHSVYPNPFTNDTRILVEVTSPNTPAAVPVEVDVTVFTTSGHRVKRLSGALDQGGVVILPWDGRDDDGDEIANGTYLYTVRATFQTQPPLTETSTGRIVRMR